VSHQWLGMQHPDPDSVQLQTLQCVLSRLAHGRWDVENDFKLQLIFHERGLRPKQWWKDTMKTMYIWLDYMCMPQLSSCVEPPQKAVDVNNNINNNNSCGCFQTGTFQADTRNRSDVQDHRSRPGDNSELLAKAVHSLPAYVEMSSTMLILAPMVEHYDRKGEVVDWCSWRRRGWCR
jgi:hypothetical protein